MNISRKTLLVIVMGSLITAPKTQASESTQRAVSFLAPLVVCGAAAKFSNNAESAGQANLAKALSAATISLCINFNQPNHKKDFTKRLKNDLIKIALLLGTVTIANSKTALSLVGLLQPYGLDALLSEPNGSFGFGTLARNLIPYVIATKACEEAGLLTKE